MMHRLASAGGRGHRLTIVGTGPLAGQIAAGARSLGGAVVLRGYVPFGPGLLDLYRTSHVFVHVARTEGLPQVLIEAQAQGLPIVATDVGGVAAALEHGAAGLLVPPGDADALASAVRAMVADVDMRRRFAAAGLERARSLTLERTTRELAAFLAASPG
jgi:glycosyltransferase involved in cell wall biosynthesis